MGFLGFSTCPLLYIQQPIHILETIQSCPLVRVRGTYKSVWLVLSVRQNSLPWMGRYSSQYDCILITNLMHGLLSIHKILLSSTCFEPQVLIFRRIQLYTCSIWYCHSLREFLVAICCISIWSIHDVQSEKHYVMWCQTSISLQEHQIKVV